MTDVLRSRIGAEDLKFGTGKFSRQVGESTVQQVSEVNAGHVPIRDTKALFTAANVEAGLAEAMTMVTLVDQKISALTG
jgi:hypothetical protein